MGNYKKTPRAGQYAFLRQPADFIHMMIVQAIRGFIRNKKEGTCMTARAFTQYEMKPAL